MKIKLLILDFDGTIADSKSIWIESISKSLKERGIKINKRVIKEKIGYRLRDFLKLSKIKKRDRETLRREIKESVAERIKTVKPAPHFTTIKRIKMRKVIVSNSPRKILENFFSRHKMRFDYIITDPRTKEGAIRFLCKKYRVNVNEAIYVADKIRDKKAAQSVGCKYILVRAVSWDKPKLSKMKNKNIINNLKGLYKIL